MEGTSKDFTSQFEEFEKTLEDNHFLCKTDFPGKLDSDFILATKVAPCKTKYPNLYSYWLSFQLFNPALVATWTNTCCENKEVKKEAAPKKDDDEVDLFGDDDEADIEAAKELALKKKKEVEEAKGKTKKVVIAKSIIFFDVKVYEQEQNLEELATKIKTEIVMDGLVWNNDHKIIPIAYGMNKLQMICVVEDDKVGQDDIFDKILAWEDEIQSVDVVSFQKV